MNKMAATIFGMSDTMKDMSHSSYLSVKELLDSSPWKYLHECPDRKHAQVPLKIAMETNKGDREYFNVSGKYRVNSLPI